MDRRSRIVIALFIVGSFLCDLAVVAVGRHYDWTFLAMGAFIALFFSQAGMLGIWAGLSNAHWLPRLMCIPAACGLWIGLLVLGELNGVVEGMVFLALAIVTVAIPLSGLRIIGIRLASPAEEKRSGCYRPVQFTIRHLLLWTFATAVACAVLRWLPISFDEWKGMAITLATMALLSVLSVWTALGNGLTIVRLLVFAILVPAIGWAHSVIVSVEGSTRDTIGILSAIAGLMAASLFVFRVCGFRLARVVRGTQHTEGDLSTP